MSFELKEYRLGDICTKIGSGATPKGGKESYLEEGEFAPLFPDCEPGAEPPFGNLYGVPVVVDRALAQQPEIVLRAGNHEHVIRMRFADFRRLESPRIAEFGTPLAPPAVERVPAP